MVHEYVREVVTTLIRKGRTNDIYTILQKANKNGISIDLSNISSVIDDLCKDGSIEEALDLCETMRKGGISPNIELYNVILNGLYN
jgi:leucine-rich PPR motif-containing protein, mitochondrial